MEPDVLTIAERYTLNAVLNLMKAGVIRYRSYDKPGKSGRHYFNMSFIDEPIFDTSAEARAGSSFVERGRLHCIIGWMMLINPQLDDNWEKSAMHGPLRKIVYPFSWRNLRKEQSWSDITIEQAIETIERFLETDEV